jgi:hypothetical protein
VATVAAAVGLASFWNRPKPPKPTPTPPPAASGSVVTVRSASDLKSFRPNTTYKFAPGFTHRQQVFLRNVPGLTLLDWRIDGAAESCLYVEGCSKLVIRGGAFTNSRTKTGILISKATPAPLIDGVTCTGNGEHGVYIGDGTNDGFQVLRANLSNNKRCGIQINPEIGGDRSVKGGKIVGCTIRGNAKSQGAAMNLGAWQDGLVEACTIEDNAKGIALWKGDGAQASRNVRIERNTIRRNGSGYSLQCTNGSSGHKLLNNTFDRKPVPGGWTSGPPAKTNSGPGAAKW